MKAWKLGVLRLTPLELRLGNEKSIALAMRTLPVSFIMCRRLRKRHVPFHTHKKRVIAVDNLVLLQGNQYF